MFFTFLTWLAWLERLGGLGLILLGLADSSPLPLPGSMDVLTVLLSAHQRNWWPYYAVMAVAGSLIGGYLSYLLGREGGKEALEKKLSKQRAEKLYRRFERHAFSTLFFPALLPPPFPYSPFLLAAGALNYSRRTFLIAVGLGRSIRYVALAYLGSVYGHQILGFFKRSYEPLLWTLIGLGVIGGIAALFWVIARKREGKPVIPSSQNTEDTKDARVA